MGVNPDIVILGRTGYDLCSEDPHVPLAQARRFTRYLGGSSANMAVGLSRLGAKVGMISCLGTDALSQFLIDFLDAEKVETTHIQRRAGYLHVFTPDIAKKELYIQSGHWSHYKDSMFPPMAMGETEGMVKTVFDAKTGELLGAHMVGAEVTEMIQGYVIGRSLETTEEDLMNTVFPHPTMSEMMHEAVLDAYGRALHI